MYDLKLNFSQPWLLLLLIPAFVLGLLPYFRIAKRYRRNRNRVTSTVLHLIVMTLAIFVLSGINFTYQEYNSNNEIIFVMDASFSTEAEENAKSRYLSDAVAMGNSEVFNIGVVTFGYDQKYAVPLTNDLNGIMSAYESAEKPDTTSATDIASALLFAREKITKPESAKIVLVSDGVETDARASAVIRSIAADGVRVDTVCCSTLVSGVDALITDTKFPEYNLVEEEEFDIVLTVKSNSTASNTTPATIVMYDNNEQCGTVSVELAAATQEVPVPHKLKGAGLHSIRFELTCDRDEIAENNVVYSYIYLDKFDKILIIEGGDAQSDYLTEILTDNDVTVMRNDEANLIQSLDELRAYDEIIFNNIADKDISNELMELINKYVYDIGGGLFTVGGGENGDPETAHAYDRKDMAGKLYQQMLPVQAINYTPPLALEIIVDVSGSMGSASDTNSKVAAAKAAATSIVRDQTCLTERDYCGVMTLSDTYEIAMPPLSMTRYDEILESIYKINGSGGTLFSPAIERAALDLLSLQGRVEKMHCILITDGGVANNDGDRALGMVQKYNEQGVTFSFVGVGANDAQMSTLQTLADAGGGRAIKSDVKDLTLQLKDDIRVPEIKNVEYGPFVPTIDTNSYYASIVSQEDMPTLEGFYGTKARAGAEVVLTGEYGVPIYAQWKYGQGSVGSFMCDLSNVWSKDFIQKDSGKAFVKSAVTKMFPTTSIRPKDIEVALNEGNYTTQMSIFPSTDLKEGESIRVNVINNAATPADADVNVTAPSADTGYSRGSFDTITAGVYTVSVDRVDASGNVISNTTLYKSFSYSAEYNLVSDALAGQNNMAMIAEYGNGEASIMSEAQPWRVFENFVYSFLRKYDPRLPLIIVAIVLFLLDIAVRKFKFKWPHEMIRDYRDKKREKNGGTKA